MAFRINCLICGHTGDRSFPIDIDKNDGNEEVAFLKGLIKKAMKPRLDHLAASDLQLFEVDLPYTFDFKYFKPDTDPLLPDKPLKMFQRRARNHVHVIVDAEGLEPDVDLLINCLMLSDKSTFTISIPKTKSVSILKDDIKDRNPLDFRNTAARHLMLWRVNVPISESSSIGLPTETQLENGRLLSELFRPLLDPKLIHVVVHGPESSRGEREEMRDTIAALDRRFEATCGVILKALVPSCSAKSSAYPKSQIDYSIHDGRYKDNNPRSSIGPPIELFNPAFGHFLDDIRCTPDGDIPKDIIRSVTRYMKAASAIYKDEQTRRNKLIPILSSVLDSNITVIENDDKTKADGSLEGFTQQNTFLFLLKEDKNEFGDGDSDPSTQAGLSAARSWVQPKLERFRKATACPTFLIANAGPWLAVLGFVLTDCVIVQRLTDFIWVGIDSALSRSHVNRVARILYALKTSLDKLSSYYDNIGPGKLLPRYFPSITTYPHENGQHVQFEYLGYMENGFDCVTLRAQTITEPAQLIVVKFVEQYSTRAHRTLAAQGLAPRLLYHGRLCSDSKPSYTYNSLSMVVMEYIHGDTFDKSKLNKSMIETVRLELRRALNLLHDKELVFGDLRPPNVMITKDMKVKLIDFDWAGEAGQVEYPHLLSSAVEWPEGVRTLDPIKKEHDLEMLDKLFRTS